jgi:membrane associated rhomboid family serine protease
MPDADPTPMPESLQDKSLERPVIIPWMADHFFPPKPSASAAGIIRGRVAIPCEVDQLGPLIAVKEKGQPLPDWVWSPAHERVQPLHEVPEFAQISLEQDLAECVEAQERAKMWLVLGTIGTVYSGWFLGQWTSMATLMLLMFGVWPWMQAFRDARRLRQDPAAALGRQKRRVRFGVWLGSHPDWPARVFVGVLVGVFALQWWMGEDQALRAAALDKALVRNGQWWRLLTAPFLHGGLAHLAFNAMSALGLARLVAALSGWQTVFSVFLFTAVIGGVASCWVHPDVPSVGASGGILGLGGFLMMLGWRMRPHLRDEIIRPLSSGLALTALAGVLGWRMIDNAAHVGGFLAGIFAADSWMGNQVTIPLTRTPYVRFLNGLGLALYAVAVVISILALQRAF